MSDLIISKENFTFKDFILPFKKAVKVQLSSDAEESINQSFKQLQSLLESGISVYGVTTGFGKLSQIQISAKNINQLQENLIRSLV